MNWRSLFAVSVAAGLVFATSSPAAGRPVGGNADGSSFRIRPDFSHKEIYDVYEGLRKSSQAQFITTDVVLHSGHLLFDYSLRAIEIGSLYGPAEELSKVMAGTAGEYQMRLGEIPYPEFDADMKVLQAFFCVPAKILDPRFDVPAGVRAKVEKDLAEIEKHEGFAISATLPHAEDFSQYVPRGHYTRNEQFKRYFRAMMWYGRRMFRVQEVRPDCLPIDDPWSEEHKLAETRQLLMITQMLYTVKINGKPAIETWNKLYVPTVLFAGRTEDLNPAEVKAVAEKLWGKLDSRKLADKKNIHEFARAAAQFSKPKIDSSGAGREGFCFMAQRFTPDSFITQCLVTDADRPFGEGVPPHPLVYTGKREPRPFTWGRNIYIRPPERRFMPRGLDVMAVFGCDEALAMLNWSGDTEYAGYNKMVEFLRDDIGTMMAERKGENLYYAWLHALQPMMKSIASKNVPDFLRSRRWMRDKQLVTCLASWAELRHDTILYVKQSYTPAPAGAPPSPRIPHGYVEPQAEVFRRIGAMVSKMNDDLAALGVMPGGLDNNYKRFAEICERLAVIADKELAGKALSEDDDEFIAGAVAALKSATVLPHQLRKKVLSETDSKMALIADVHTDNNYEVVLEEGVGTPFLLTVKMPLAGETATLRGAVFSYYEFKHPMKDRLTDEAWQKMLADGATRPKPPEWYMLPD